MKVWPDDERPMPDGYDVHVRTASEAIDLLKTGQVTRMSLDHDLGPPEAKHWLRWPKGRDRRGGVPRMDSPDGVWRSHRESGWASQHSVVPTERSEVLEERDNPDS